MVKITTQHLQLGIRFSESRMLTRSIVSIFRCTNVDTYDQSFGVRKTMLLLTVIIVLLTQTVCGADEDSYISSTPTSVSSESTSPDSEVIDLEESVSISEPAKESHEELEVISSERDRISVSGEYIPPKRPPPGYQVPMIPVSVPKICSYPPLLNNDCLSVQRWYFSAEFRSCLPFQSGSECDANGNNFPSLAVCRQICRTSTFLELELRSMTEWRCGTPYIDHQQCRPGEWPDVRFYYDETLTRCAAMDVEGCAASNTFVTLDDCTFYCRQQDLVLEKVPLVTCQLPKVRGFEICYNGQPRWYYDWKEKQCRSFMYTGCFGNWNNFLSYGDCQHVCGGKEDGPDVCSLPPDTGTSFQYRTRYYYDNLTQACRPLKYSGFGGNANNFFLPEDCESECSQ